MIYIGLINNEIKLSGSDVEAVKDGAFACGLTLDSIEQTDREVITAWDGKMYFKGEEPEKPYDYAEKRRQNYPDLTEQLDKLYHDIEDGLFGDDAKTSEFYQARKKIKEAYPKQEEEINTEMETNSEEGEAGV